MSRKVTGLDITPFALRVVELERGFSDSRITRVARVNLTEGQGLKEAFESIFDTPPARDSIIAGIDGLGLCSRIMEFPFSSRKKIAQVVPYELESEVPIPIEDLIISHQVLSSTATTSRVMITGVERERLVDELDKLLEAGIEPRALIPTSGILSNAAAYLYSFEAGYRLFLDIGHHSSSICAVGPEGVEAFRTLPYGLMDIARELRKEHGFASDEECVAALQGSNIHDLSTALVRAMQKTIFTELKRTVHAFRNEKGIEASGLVLSGDLPINSAVMEALSQSVGVEKVEPLKLPREHFTGEFEGDIGFGRALGLALSDVSKKFNVNMRAGEFAFHSRFEVARERLILPAVLIALIFFASLANSAIQAKNHMREAAGLESRIATVFAGAMPEQEPVQGREVKMLEKRLAELKSLSLAAGELSGPTPMSLLSAISYYIVKDIEVDVDEIVFDKDIVKLTGIVSEYADLDRISSALMEHPGFVKIDPPDTKDTIDKKTRFTFKIFTKSSQTSKEGK